MNHSKVKANQLKIKRFLYEVLRSQKKVAIY